MCGIVVSLEPEGEAPRLPLERLAHRGPDARGEVRLLDGRLWLGHTRLAILDLSERGNQPMEDPETGNWIVFNGEIYNHRELRESPELAGFDWRGTSDTETLLAAYRAWGREALGRLKGMFAFVLYDPGRGVLMAARDRLGIKPLYHRRAGPGWRFASECRALSDDPALEVSPQAASAYLQWGAFPESALPGEGEGLAVVPAGCYWEIPVEVAGDRVGAGATCVSYWPPVDGFRSPPPGAANRDAEDPVAGVRQRLETAVREHLIADVPVASFLSGGIDSSVVTALAARELGPRLKTFSVGFEQGDFDETAIAEEVSRRCGTDHERILLTEDEILARVGEAVAAMDLPSLDAVNTYVVSHAVAARGIKVALSGLGGDELFGGYPSFTDVGKFAFLARVPAGLRRLAYLGGEKGHKLAEIPRGVGTVELAHYRRTVWSRRMLKAAGLPTAGTGRPLTPPLRDAFAEVSWAELSGYMRHILLRDSDQMSMAVSLELRVPFLDHELVGYVLSLPAAAKAGYPRAKGLLVEACRDLLPTSVYERPKMGFVLPMESWMRGPLAPLVTRGLEAVVDSGLLAEAAVAAVRTRFERGRLSWSRVWALVALGHYLDRGRSGATGQVC